jgi:hypothetical protein
VHRAQKGSNPNIILFYSILRYCVKHSGQQEGCNASFVTHYHKSFSFILVHTIYLLTVSLYKPTNGTSHNQHNSITVDINLSHYSIATRSNHITVILRLTISTQMCTYYGCTKLCVHWNAISSPQVLHTHCCHFMVL